MTKPKTEKTEAERLAEAVERAAQRIYDLRDTVPAGNDRAWAELDRVATRLSKLGASYRRQPAPPRLRIVRNPGGTSS